MNKDRYARIYEQFEEEAERYFRDYTLYDVDRYGLGGGIMKLILSMMAMHAMSSMIGNQSQAGQQGQKPSAAAPTTPSNQDFEKLHPRAQTPGGGQKPGQFTSKPDTGGSAPTPAPPQRQARPLTERPDMQSRNTMNPQNPPAAPQPQIQTPTDPNTARIAEIWHGKGSGQAEDFGAGVDVTPQPLKTEPAAPNPRKKTLPDGSANPAYDPQQLIKPSEGNNPQFGQTRAFGRNGMVSFSSPDHMDIHDLGSMWLKNSGKWSDSQRQKHLADAQAKTSELAAKHGMSEHEMKFHAIDTAKETSRQAKGMVFGDSRDIQYTPFKKPQDQQVATEKPSLLDREESAPASNQDIFANPAAKARKEKAELDRITKFDPTEFGDGVEQPDAPMAKVSIEDFTKRNGLGKVIDRDYTALEAARDERAKQVKAFSDWESKTQKDPATNIADVATEHELDHEPFSKYANEMQAFEEGEWRRRERVKSNIRKAWGIDGSDLRTMENRGQDHSNLMGADQLKGSVADADIYEFLGSDEQEWAQNAWAMLREDPPERPGAHSKDWLQSHAENFKRLQSMIEPETQDYPEPEDGMPFSRKSLTKEIDRYFRQHLSRIRATKANSDSQSWTALDSWL